MARSPGLERVVRLGPLVVLVASVGIAVALAVRDYESLYSAPSWILLGLLVVVGLVLAADQRMGSVPPAVALLAAALGAVVGAELAGTGVWAIKHWEPFFGPLGGSTMLLELRALAALLVLCGAVASLVCLLRLVDVSLGQPRSNPAARVVCTVVGLALMASLPWLLARGEPDFTDFTSIGAMALVYSVPWGAALVATGWLSRAPATALGSAVGLLTLLALAGPKMADITPSHPKIGFAVGIAAAAVALLSVRGSRKAPADRRRASPAAA